MFEDFLYDCSLTMPFWGWAFLGVILILVQMLSPGPKLATVFTLGGLIILLGFSLITFDPLLNETVFNELVVVDAFSQAFNILGLLVAFVLVLMMIPGMDSPSSLIQKSYEQLAEFFICLVFSGFGLAVVAAANDLTSLFLGIETLSIAVYCLCGFYRTEIRSTESGFKYLLIGAFSTVIFLYGIAFVYGASGATDYLSIKSAASGGITPLFSLGVIFLLGGLAFKLALVPFHLYTPDVYEGAPTPVTAYLATGIKIGGVAAALRILWGFLEPLSSYWSPYWMALCALSILVGNVSALQQKTIKKLLAFSSISHAGFLGLALLIAKPVGGDIFPLFAYLTVYSAMTLGIFALLTYLEDRQTLFKLEDLKGLGRERFGIGFLFALFILGLAGIPPFAGFMIKFWVLQGLIEQGYLAMAFVAIVGSLIGAVYYLRLLAFIFMSPESGASISWPLQKDKFLLLRIILVATALLTAFGGVRPQLYADWILVSLALK